MKKKTANLMLTMAGGIHSHVLMAVSPSITAGACAGDDIFRIDIDYGRYSPVDASSGAVAKVL